MQRTVYITRLRPEYREQYIEAHRNVPRELLEKYRGAGIRDVAVYLKDDTLVLVIDEEGPPGARESLANDPACAAWEEKMRPMKSAEDYQPMTEVFREPL